MGLLPGKQGIGKTSGGARHGHLAPCRNQTPEAKWCYEVYTWVRGSPGATILSQRTQCSLPTPRHNRCCIGLERLVVGRYRNQVVVQEEQRNVRPHEWFDSVSEALLDPNLRFLVSDPHGVSATTTIVPRVARLTSANDLESAGMLDEVDAHAATVLLEPTRRKVRCRLVDGQQASRRGVQGLPWVYAQDG